MAVIIYGPQGCGKTTQAQVLAKHYGLTNILDEWDPSQGLTFNTLALTVQKPTSEQLGQIPFQVQVYSFNEAMLDCLSSHGFKLPSEPERPQLVVGSPEEEISEFRSLAEPIGLLILSVARSLRRSK